MIKFAEEGAFPRQNATKLGLGLKENKKKKQNKKTKLVKMNGRCDGKEARRGGLVACGRGKSLLKMLNSRDKMQSCKGKSEVVKNGQKNKRRTTKTKVGKLNGRCDKNQAR